MEARPQALRREELIAFLLASAIASESPRAFVQELYASYRNSSFSPLDHPERIFAPPLRAAIRDDERLAHGEVGFLDGDPLCDCQDTGGMNARIVSLEAGSRSANARVSVRFEGSAETRDIRLKLVRTGAGWRIADVGTRDEPSLLHDLQQSNLKARNAHRRR